MVGEHLGGGATDQHWVWKVGRVIGAVGAFAVIIAVPALYPDPQRQALAFGMAFFVGAIAWGCSGSR